MLQIMICKDLQGVAMVNQVLVDQVLVDQLLVDQQLVDQLLTFTDYPHTWPGSSVEKLVL